MVHPLTEVCLQKDSRLGREINSCTKTRFEISFYLLNGLWNLPVVFNHFWLCKHKIPVSPFNLMRTRVSWKAAGQNWPKRFKKAVCEEKPAGKGTSPHSCFFTSLILKRIAYIYMYLEASQRLTETQRPFKSWTSKTSLALAKIICNPIVQAEPRGRDKPQPAPNLAWPAIATSDSVGSTSWANGPALKMMQQQKDVFS